MQTLGTWDTQGYPSYLVSRTPDAIDDLFLKDVNLSLPEYKSLPVYHPDYLVKAAPPTIAVKELSDVWITFVSEGAGWTNTLGFYTFDSAKPPTSSGELQTPTIIFPNVSRSGSGGSLLPGHKVKLGRFQAGTNIGFFMIADAFRSGKVTTGRYTHYSHEAFNVEPNLNLRRHIVILDDTHSDRLVLAMEDIRRDSTGCDHDFNDAVFYITSNPVRSIQDPAIPLMETTQPCPAICAPVRVSRLKK